MRTFRNSSGQVVTFPDTATDDEIRSRLREVDSNRRQTRDQMVTELERRSQGAELPLGLHAAQFAGSLGAAGASTLLALPRLTGQLSETMLGPNGYSQFWDETAKLIEDQAQIDPRESFITKDLPSGIGSMLGMALTAGSGAWGKVGTVARAAVTGAVNGYVEGYERAKSGGEDELNAVMNGLTGAAIGTSEAWTLTKWINRFNRRTGTSVAQRLARRSAARRAVTEAGQEAVQEFGQTLGEDVSAAVWTQEEMDWAKSLRSAGRAAAVGGITGSGMSAVSTAVEQRDRGNRLAQLQTIRNQRQRVRDMEAEAPERAGRTVEMAARLLPGEVPEMRPGTETTPSPRDISGANRPSGMNIGFGFLGNFVNPEGKYDRAAASEQVTRAINNTLQGSGTVTLIQPDGNRRRITSAERIPEFDAEGRVISTPMRWTDSEGSGWTVDDIANGAVIELRGYTRPLPALLPGGLRQVKPTVPQGAPMPVESEVFAPETLNYTDAQRARWSASDPSSVLWLGENHPKRLDALIADLEQQTSGRQMTKEEQDKYVWWQFQRYHLRRFMQDGAQGRKDPRQALREIADLLQLRVDHSAGFPLASYPQYAKDKIGTAGALLTEQGEPLIGTPKGEAEAGAAQQARPGPQGALTPEQAFPGTEGQWNMQRLLSRVIPLTEEMAQGDPRFAEMAMNPERLKRRPIIRLINPNNPEQVVRMVFDGLQTMEGAAPEVAKAISTALGMPTTTHTGSALDPIISLKVPGMIIQGLQAGGTSQGAFEMAIAHGWVVHPEDAAKLPGYNAPTAVAEPSTERIPSLQEFSVTQAGQGPVAAIDIADPAYRTKVTQAGQEELRMAADAAGVKPGKNANELANNMAKAAKFASRLKGVTADQLSKDPNTLKEGMALFKATGAAPKGATQQAQFLLDRLEAFKNFPARLSGVRYEQYLLHTLNYRGDLTEAEIGKIITELRGLNPKLAETVAKETAGKKAGQFSFKTILPAEVLTAMDQTLRPGKAPAAQPEAEQFGRRLEEMRVKEAAPAAPPPASGVGRPPQKMEHTFLPGDPIPEHIDVVNVPTSGEGWYAYMKGSSNPNIYRATENRRDGALLWLRDTSGHQGATGFESIKVITPEDIMKSREVRVALGKLDPKGVPELFTQKDALNLAEQMGLPMETLLKQAEALSGVSGQLGRVKTQPLLGMVKLAKLAQPHPYTGLIRVVDSKGASHRVPKDSFIPVKVKRKVQTKTGKQAKQNQKTKLLGPSVTPVEPPPKGSTDDPRLGSKDENVSVQQQGTTDNADTPPAGRNTPVQQNGMVSMPRATEAQATTAFRGLVNNPEFLATYPHAAELLRSGQDYYPQSWEEGRKAAEAVMQGYPGDLGGMERAVSDFTKRETLHRMADNFRPYILGELLKRNREMKLVADNDMVARHAAIEESIWNFLTLNQSVAGQTLQASQYILSQFSPEYVASKLNMQFRKYWKGDMTPEQQAKVMELTEKLQQSFEGPKGAGIPKSRAYQELVSYIEQNITITPWDKFQSWWYASVLSSVTTQFENAMTAVNVLTNGFMQAINARDPITGFYFFVRGLANLTDLNNLASTYRVFQEIPTEHFNKLEDSGVYDYYWTKKDRALTAGAVVSAAVRRQWLKNAIERNRQAGGARRLLNLITVPTRNITVFMGAMDFALAQMGADQKAAYLAIREHKKPSDMTGRDYRNMIKKIIGTDRESMDAAKREAVTEAEAGLIKASDIALRARELALKKRPDQIAELADRYGLEMTGNIEPYGFLGTIYKGLVSLRSESKALQMIAPFMRYAVNWANTTINFMPAVGFTRWALAQAKVNRGSRYAPNLSPEAEMDLMQQMRLQGLVGTAAFLVILKSAMEGVDEEEPWLQFTGSFKFLPAAKRKQLMNSGIMPYSIRIGGHSFSYRQLPFASGIAMAGEISDRARYLEGPIDWAEVRSRWAGAAGTGALMTLDMPALVGLSDFLMTVNMRAYSPTDTEYGPVQAVAELVKRYTTGAVVPGWIKDIDQWFDPHVKDRASLTPTEWITRDLPIARRKVPDSINVLGDPVVSQAPPFKRLVGPTPATLVPKAEDVALYQEMARRNQQGVFIPWALQATFERPDGAKQKLSDYDSYTYRQEVGRRMKELLTENLEWFKGLDRNSANQWLRAKYGEISAFVRDNYDWRPEVSE